MGAELQDSSPISVISNFGTPGLRWLYPGQLLAPVVAAVATAVIIITTIEKWLR